jgi:hypothetical protein
MKSVNIILMAAVLVLGLAVTASAMDKDEMQHGPTVVVPEAQGGSRAVGDDCTNPIIISSLPYTATAQTNCGRLNDYAATCLGNYDGGEDIIYRLDLATATVVDIVMNPGATTWTGILIDDACPPDPATCIATNSGSSGTRQLFGVALAAGSYYIMVDTWPTPTCIPAFDLTITVGTPYPNPTCATAIDLGDDALVTFPVNTCGGGNDYSPTNLCTGYAAVGEDAVWKIAIAPGELITVTLAGETYDASIYLLSDCSDMNSCVAGGDDPETFTYSSPTGGVFYLIIDGYSGCGSSVVTIEAPIVTESSSWGTVKALYN